MPLVIVLLTAAAALTSTAWNLIQICQSRTKAAAMEQLRQEVSALKIQNAYRKHVESKWKLGPFSLETDRYFR